MNTYNFTNQYKAVTKSILLAVLIILVILDILLLNNKYSNSFCGYIMEQGFLLSSEAPGVSQSWSFVTHRQTNGLIRYGIFSDNFL